MSGGFNMKKFLGLIAIVLPVAVMAVQPGCNSFAGVNPAAEQWTGVAPIGVADPILHATPGLSRAGGGPLLLAKDIDLREVDWDKVKSGKNGSGDDSVGNEMKDDGDDGEEEDGEEEKDDKDGEEEGGGWDRRWDAPKSG
jgi:hypothetical protein